MFFRKKVNRNVSIDFLRSLIAITALPLSSHLTKPWSPDKDAKEKAAVITAAAGVTLKDIQSIDYSWGEIEFEVSPMNRLMKACAPAPAACEEACCDMDIVPDDIEVADTVTIVWEIA